MSNMFRDMGDLQESAYRLSKETQCDARTDRANEQKSVKCYSMDMEHHEHGSFSLNIASVFVPYTYTKKNLLKILLRREQVGNIGKGIKGSQLTKKIR